MAHILRAHSGCEIDVSLRPGDLFVKITKEVRANAVRDDLEVLLGAVFLYLLREIQVEILRPAAVGELDAVEAEFSGLVDDAHETELVLVDV